MYSEHQKKLYSMSKITNNHQTQLLPLKESARKNFTIFRNLLKNYFCLNFKTDLETILK